MRWPWVSRRAHEDMYNQMLGLWRSSSGASVAAVEKLSRRIDAVIAKLDEPATPAPANPPESSKETDE